MYKTGKWLVSLRNKYGYKAVFTKYVYKSSFGPYDHHDAFKIKALIGKHDTSFDVQKVYFLLSKFILNIIVPVRNEFHLDI